MGKHAREQIHLTFWRLLAARKEAHVACLHGLPLYTLYQQYHGNPPLQPLQLELLQNQIKHANAIYKAGVDEDWRRSWLEAIAYYFDLADIGLPGERDPAVQSPKFGETGKNQKR